MLLRIFILLFIIIIIVFIAKWGLGKLSFFKSRKKHLYVISGLIGVLSFTIYALSLSYFITKMPQDNFDKTVWINNISERHKMIDDLLKSNYLIGKNFGEIREVFGEPKELDSDKNIIIYELIGQTALDFKITTLKLHIKDSIVQKFTYDTVIE
ncbi:MAG: hypothetical protein ACJAZK_001681 [Psychroserpens sp.]|jgi:hypothetical protein|uniref:hypothetical protein n=1 Tax=Psychroserpens sp. TaxID=2020870 RepID=UPI0039E416EB